MRWPWVSRESQNAELERLDNAHRLTVKLWEGERAHLLDTIKQATDNHWMLFDKYEALVDEVVKLKREGFGGDGKPAELQITPAELPHGIAEAILERAGFGTREQRDLTQYALEQQRLDVPDSEIIERILEGQTIEL
jgi:hypothetical protein